MTERLTEAQRQLLSEVSNGEDRCSDAYRPAQILIDRGLLYWRAENRLALTSTGRALLEKEGRSS